jgi:hypothetical protein
LWTTTSCGRGNVYRLNLAGYWKCVPVVGGNELYFGYRSMFFVGFTGWPG